MTITAMRSKSDGLKADWSYGSVSPGYYSYVRGCVLAGVEQLYTGNLLTVVLALRNCGYSVLVI